MLLYIREDILANSRILKGFSQKLIYGKESTVVLFI